MTQSEKVDSLEFPINQELLAQATQVKEQWKVVRERIQKIEEHKEKVSGPVYDRVLSDYKDRLTKITAQVMEKKRTIDRELATLYETRKKITSQLEARRHSLEEIKFRNVLGEYNADEYQEKAKGEQDKISKFETILSAVNTNIGRYEDLFQEEIELLPSEEKKTREHVATKDVHEVLSEEDEEFIAEIEEEVPSYFTSDHSITTPGGKTPTVSRTSADTEHTSPKLKPGESNARVVIISGDDAGATYPIKTSISFGRAESNTIVLRDAKVSRQHAKIMEKGGEYIIIDLKSSNGTYVNSERIEEHVLSNNDEFQIGDTVMQFQK